MEGLEKEDKSLDYEFQALLEGADAQEREIIYKAVIAEAIRLGSVSLE